MIEAFSILIESPEHSEKVQKRLFELGFRWSGGQIPQYTFARYIGCDISSRCLDYGNRPAGYTNWNQKTLEDLTDEASLTNDGNKVYTYPNGERIIY